MRDLLRGYAAATFESAAEAGHARQVGDDLEAFSRVLIESEPLHNVLTDMAIPPRARRGVVHDLLEGKGCPRDRRARVLGRARGTRRRRPGRDL